MGCSLLGIASVERARGVTWVASVRIIRTQSYHLISGSVGCDRDHDLAFSEVRGQTTGPICQSGNEPQGRAVTHRPWTRSAGVSRSLMRGVALCLAQDSSFRDQTNGHIAPESDHQLARQSDDGDTPDMSSGIADLLHEPAGQRTLRLMPEPKPGELDGEGSNTRIARFADPLINAHGAAVERARRKPEVARNFTAIIKVSVESFAGPPLPSPRLSGRPPLSLSSPPPAPPRSP